MSIKVILPGLLTSIQDLGRFGYQKNGVIVSGAMDSYALRIANLLVGNEEGEAALEITLIGPSLEILQDTIIAVTGGDLSPTIGGKPIPLWRPVYVKEGSILHFGTCKSGCRTYLSVAGGFAIPEVLGSRSTYLRAQIGGYQGRAFKKGDVLRFRSLPEQSICLMKQLKQRTPFLPFASVNWSVGRGRVYTRNPTVRVIRGEHFGYFTSVSRGEFFDKPFQVTPQSDRMGYRLSGSSLKLSEPLEIISEAVSLGTIQVPPDGNPIILLADRQTTGGYPIIAQVASVDVAILAQSKPGDKINFEEITLSEAERLYLEREKYIHNLKTGIYLKFI